jgi:DHA1 family bicyclomycin/chloramphenicol resistance-like MFS transporter
MRESSIEIPFLFLVVLGLLMGLPPIATDLYLPAMPTIGGSLRARPESVQQTITLYLACFSLCQLFFGPLSDDKGRKKVMLAGVVIFAIGSFLCAVANNIATLIAFRGLQGIGAAAIVVTVPAIVRDKATGAEFSRTMGFIMMVMGLAPLVAPLLGSAILLFAGWRMIFVILGATAALVGVLYIRNIGETLSQSRRGGLNVGNLARNYLSVLKQKPAMLYMFCSSLAVAAMFGFLTASPFVYIEYYGVSEQGYGVLFAMNIVLMTALTALSNRLVGVHGPRRMLGLGVTLIVVSSILMIFVATMRNPTLALVVVAIMLFIGTAGVVNANAMALILRHLGHISGSASAVAGCLRFGLGAFASVLVAQLYDGTAFALSAVMAACGLGAGACFLLARYLTEKEGDTALLPQKADAAS